MICFPNAKINIGLSITERRDDGFHNLESIFYPINWCDILEITPSEQLSFTSSGIPIPGDQSNNLCLKVYHLLKERYDLPPVAIHLKKIIPIGAGLGGGSSDAAYTLKLLNEMFDLKMQNDEMEKIIQPLGSDCAFFIQNKPVFAHGKGELFDTTQLDLYKKELLLVNPNIHISTKEAYAGVSPKTTRNNLRLLTSTDLFKNPKLAHNDFEDSILPNHPEINAIKKEMISHGALYSSMSGSGSTVFGVFESIPENLFFNKYTQFKTIL